MPDRDAGFTHLQTAQPVTPGIISSLMSRWRRAIAAACGRALLNESPLGAAALPAPARSIASTPPRRSVLIVQWRTRSMSSDRDCAGDARAASITR
jgi:hypothetical protein